MTPRRSAPRSTTKPAAALAALQAAIEAPATPAETFFEAALRAPRIAAQSTRVATAGPADFVMWPEDVIAALLCQPEATSALRAWAADRNVGLWNLARWVAGPESERQPRDWSHELLARLAKIASGFLEPLPASAVDLLADTFHLGYAHATGERLAWIDVSTWSRDALRALRDHPGADARALVAVLRRLDALYHAGEPVKDTDLLSILASPAMDDATVRILALDPPAECAIGLLRGAAIQTALGRGLLTGADRAALAAHPEPCVSEALDAPLENAPGARRATRRAAPAAPAGASPMIPPFLPALLATVLDGDEDDVRAAMEKVHGDAELTRLLDNPHLDEATRRRVRIRVLRFGMSHHRDAALARLLASPTLDDAALSEIAAQVFLESQCKTILADERLPAEALRTLWPRFPHRQHSIMEHPRAPRDLVEGRSDYVLSTAITSTTDEAWLAELAATPQVETSLHAFCANPRCPEAALVIAAARPVVSCRCDAARHPGATPELLTRLASDEDVLVRAHVASNLRSPMALLDRLAMDPEVSVRSEVARNPSTSMAALLMLLADTNKHVQKAAAKAEVSARLAAWRSSRGTPERDMAEAPVAERKRAAARADLEPRAQAALVGDPHREVREALAGNPALAVEHLVTLASDASTLVRRAVALSPRTPEEARHWLARDPCSWVRRAVVDGTRAKRAG